MLLAALDYALLDCAHTADDGPIVAKSIVDKHPGSTGDVRIGRDGVEEWVENRMGERVMTNLRFLLRFWHHPSLSTCLMILTGISPTFS
eukprot:COSAG05_NODE_561_length_8675_cov_3.694846_7_plen_89_part_00